MKGIIKFISKLLIGALVAVLIINVLIALVDYALRYPERVRQQKVVDGQVRGNKLTRRYMVASCPAYEEIPTAALIVFSGTLEANEMDYKPDPDCYSDIEFRRSWEDWDGQYPEQNRDGPM